MCLHSWHIGNFLLHVLLSLSQRKGISWMTCTTFLDIRHRFYTGWQNRKYKKGNAPETLKAEGWDSSKEMWNEYSISWKQSKARLFQFRRLKGRASEQNNLNWALMVGGGPRGAEYMKGNCRRCLSVLLVVNVCSIRAGTCSVHGSVPPSSEAPHCVWGTPCCVSLGGTGPRSEYRDIDPLSCSLGHLHCSWPITCLHLNVWIQRRGAGRQRLQHQLLVSKGSRGTGVGPEPASPVHRGTYAKGCTEGAAITAEWPQSGCLQGQILTIKDSAYFFETVVFGFFPPVFLVIQ